MSVVNDIYKEANKNTTRVVDIGWHTGNRVSYVEIKYNKGTEEIENKSRHKLLDKKAKDWGNINHRETVVNNDKFLIKYYSCSGHGGYLVLTQHKLKGVKPVTDWSNFNSTKIPQFYIYQFEEDCGWSRLFVEAPEHIRRKLSRQWEKEWESTDRTVSEHIEKAAWESYQKWHLNKEDIDFRA